MSPRKLKSDSLREYFKLELHAECHFCGKQYADDENYPQSEMAAQRLYCLGWREISSRRYQVIALACPPCAKSKDSER